MKSRPWQIWTIFAVCLLAVLFGMIRLTAQLLELERSEARARKTAKLEENIRLALWRMDSFLSPIIARENAREPYEYQRFYAVEDAYRNSAAQADTGTKKILIPSRLLDVQSEFILLHFQVDNQNIFRSPQIPEEKNMKKMVQQEHIRDYTERMNILKKFLNWQIAAARLDTRSDVRKPETNVQKKYIVQVEDTNAPDQIKQQASSDYQIMMNDKEMWARSSNKEMQTMNAMIQQGRKSFTSNRKKRHENCKTQQQSRKQKDNRKQQKQDAEQRLQVQQAETQQKKKPQPAAQKSRPRITDRPPGIDRQIMQPCWVSGNLFLLREVTLNSRPRIQGVWLNWNAIRKQMLENIRDLLPGALLEMSTDTAGETPCALASVPAALVPGDIRIPAPQGIQPIRLSLYIAWACFLAGAGAAGVLVIGIVLLSERRAEFVSSVTHELRTPLTTFKMYTEMLLNNMLPSAQQRKNYLQTLSVQADRLVHLIENVLAFARLERKRAGTEIETVNIGVLVDGTLDSIRERARLADMEVAVENQTRPETMVRTDMSAVQHILYNLVDNACKYAAEAIDRRIHIDVTQSKEKWIDIQVRDHGPGISRDIQKKMFKAFSKSAAAAAGNVPGVGLGLAISLRLARKSGGQLSYQQDPGGGACFILRLPRA